MVRGRLRFCVGLGSEPEEGARTWPLWPKRGRFVRMSCLCGTPFTRVSASWLLNVRRIYGKTRPVTAAGAHALRDEYTRAIQPSRARKGVRENVMFSPGASSPLWVGAASWDRIDVLAMGMQGGLLRPESFEQLLGQVTLAALGPAHHGVKEWRPQCRPPERLRSVNGCLSAG
jgi:hypothetical protein